MLQNLIEQCGGKENIRRALRVDEKLVLELIEAELRPCISETISYNPVLCQVSYTPEEALTEQDWRYLSELIESNQRFLINQIQASEFSSYRPCWHIAPKQGFLNDPNGFIFHNGEYHLFYGLDPQITGDKTRFWMHYTTTDFVNWQEKPVALCPSDWFDCHGVYSGHAVSTDKELLLFYTGNVRVGEQRDRVTTQCIASSEDGIRFTKHGPVIKELPPGVTPHCRDPKLFRNKDHWLMILGAQNETDSGNLQGRLAIYRSEDLYTWSYVGLSGEELGDFGYMWECPDLLQVDGQLLSIICPQGIHSPSEYHNIPHHSGYLIAELSADDQLSLSDFKQLDFGFDFYASQTTTAPDGRSLLVGWMGMPDELDQPSLEENWIHQLTCIRELSWKKGKLYQNPARELEALWAETHLVDISNFSEQRSYDMPGKSYELKTHFTWPDKGKVTLRLMDNGEHYCDFILDADNQRILLDRSHMLKTDGEKIREIPWPCRDDVELQILADISSLELFINNGEYVMSARVFSPADATKIRLLSDEPYHWTPVSYRVLKSQSINSAPEW